MIFRLTRLGAPQIMGSAEPGWPNQGADIKAMPTIRATNTSLGSREVDINDPIAARPTQHHPWESLRASEIIVHFMMLNG